MKRYDHDYGGMDSAPDGEYVEYEEAAARIAVLGQQLAERDKEIVHLKSCLALADGLTNKARQRIADWEQRSAGIVTLTLGDIK